MALAGNCAHHPKYTGVFRLALLQWRNQVIKSGSGQYGYLDCLGTGSAWLYSCIVIDYSATLPTLAKHAYFEAARSHSGLY